MTCSWDCGFAKTAVPLHRDSINSIINYNKDKEYDKDCKAAD